jgi:hypothetical protein
LYNSDLREESKSQRAPTVQINGRYSWRLFASLGEGCRRTGKAIEPLLAAINKSVVIGKDSAINHRDL